MSVPSQHFPVSGGASGTSSFQPNSSFNPGLMNSNSLNDLNEFSNNFYSNNQPPFVGDMKNYPTSNTAPTFTHYPGPHQLQSSSNSYTPHFNHYSGGPSLVDGNTIPMHSSLSAPTIHDQSMSDDLAPIDLSNPLTNSSAPQDIPVTNFLPNAPSDEGIDFNAPPINW